MKRTVEKILERGFWFCALFLLTGCPRENGSSLSGTVALVNDEAITAQELVPMITEVRGQASKATEVTKEEKQDLKRRLLGQLIDRKMLLQEARRLKINLSEGEARQRLDEMAEGKSAEAFAAYLSDQGMTLEAWEKATREDLLIEKLVNQLAQDQVSITEGDLKQYYKVHPEGWTLPEGIKFRQIVVESAAEAERLRRSLEEGSDFDALARAHSLSPDSGAEEEYRSRSEIPEEFDPLMMAPIGSISGVIKTSFGYHLVHLVDRRPPGTLSFEEVKEKIYQILLQEKREALFAEWMQGIRGRTEVKINEALLDKIP